MKDIKVKREMVGNRFFSSQQGLVITIDGERVVPSNTTVELLIEKLIELPQGISKIEIEPNLSIIVYVDSIEEWVGLSQKQIINQSASILTRKDIVDIEYLKDIVSYISNIEGKLKQISRKPIERENIEMGLEDLLK